MSSRHALVLIVVFTVFYVTVSPVSAEDAWWQNAGKLLGGPSSARSILPDAEVSAGLKQALEVATDRVVVQLGQPGGFSSNPQIRIPLPSSLDAVRGPLSAVGMAGTLDDLEDRLNVAAEAATPRAKDLFLAAISELTLKDAQQILSGPDDAATRYFQKKMSKPLADEMSPIVMQTLAESGAVQSYDVVMARYQSLPFVPDVKANLVEYVVQKGSDGIFLYIGRQEAAIRNDPAKRTTDLLRTVFAER